MSDRKFDVSVSLTKEDIYLTPHERFPASAVENVREAIEAIPGASWVSVDMVLPFPRGAPLIERLEPVGWEPEKDEDLERIREKVDYAVLEGLGSPLRLPSRRRVCVPAPVLAACAHRPDSLVRSPRVQEIVDRLTQAGRLRSKA